MVDALDLLLQSLRILGNEDTLVMILSTILFGYF